MANRKLVIGGIIGVFVIVIIIVVAVVASTSSSDDSTDNIDRCLDLKSIGEVMACSQQSVNSTSCFEFTDAVNGTRYFLSGVIREVTTDWSVLRNRNFRRNVTEFQEKCGELGVGGHLSEINSKEEFEFVRKLGEDSVRPGHTTWAMLGAWDNRQKGNYTYIRGNQAVQYVNWASSPVRYPELHASPHTCMFLDWSSTSGGMSDGCCWPTRICTSPTRFLCEVPCGSL